MRHTSGPPKRDPNPFARLSRINATSIYKQPALPATYICVVNRQNLTQPPPPAPPRPHLNEIPCCPYAINLVPRGPSNTGTNSAAWQLPKLSLLATRMVCHKPWCVAAPPARSDGESTPTHRPPLKKFGTRGSETLIISY